MSRLTKLISPFYELNPCPRRDYWTINRGPCFLVVVWFGSSPTPYPRLPSASWLYFSIFLFVGAPSSLAIVQYGSSPFTPPPPPPVSKLDRRQTGRLRNKNRRRVGERVGVRERESLVLYKSFNILCAIVWIVNASWVFARCWKALIKTQTQKT